MRFTFRVLLAFVVCLTNFLMVGVSRAQVYVGGVQTSIGSPNSPWTGPVGVATDTSGNVYVAQFQTASSIVRIDALTHATSTILTSACGVDLSYVQQIASDSSNNLYLADQGNDRLVVYNLISNVCTASYPVSSPFGVTLDASSNIWVATSSGPGSSIDKIPAGSASGTSPTVVVSSGLQSTGGITFDANGNLYLSDPTASAVYKYTSPNSSPTRSTFLSSSQGSNTPFGMMFDASGNFYVCESGSNQVLKYLASASYGTYVVVSPSIVGAEGVAQDSNGNLFLTAYQGSTVTEISVTTGNFGQINVGSSSTQPVNFDVVSGTAVGSFRVLDQGITGLEFVEQSPDTNTNLCSTGSAAYGSTTACAINVTFAPSYPGQRLGVVQALSTNGTVLATAYISGTGLAPLVGFSPASTSVLTVTGLSGGIIGPRRPALDPQGNLYIADFGNGRLVKVTPAGVGSVIATPGYTVSGPHAVALDGAGNLYIDSSSNVVKVDISGAASQLNNNGLTISADGLAVDAAGNVFTADSSGSRIIEWPGGGAAEVVSISGVTLNGPTSVVVDGSSNLYIADAGNNRIVKVANGVGSVLNLGSVVLNNSRALNIDSPGNLYISDTGNDRIVEVPSSGGTPIIVKTGSSITLNTPEGAAISGTGSLYIMDSGNNRIVFSNQSVASSFAFDVTEVGLTSADSPQTATLLNLGNQALTIASTVFATTTPANGTSFVSDSSTTCSTTLAANSSCIYGINFSPAAMGSNIGSLTLTDDTLRSSATTQTIPLSGTGEQITITPATLAAATFGVSYSTTLSASGGTGPYIFGVVTGTLPAGLSLSSAGVISGTPTQPGTFTFSVQATDSSASPGPYSGAINYSLTVARATPTITWPTPAAITYGTALTGTQLNATATGSGGASLPGSFSYSPAAGAVLNAGSAQTLGVTFTPVDTTDYSTASGSVTIRVNKASSTLTGPAQPINLAVGQTGSISVAISGQYVGTGIATPSGSIAYTIVNSATVTVATGSLAISNSAVSVPLASNLAPGSYSVNFSYGGDTEYNTSTAVVQVTVGQIQPAITWTPPVSITYGTTLAGVLSAQAYNGASTVAGTYIYSDGATAITGTTLLPAGSYNLTVTFTPTDAAVYKTATATVAVAVAKAAIGSLVLASSVNPVLLQNATILTATVTSTISTPTGAVAFLDGTTPLGSSAVVSGVASLTVGTLTEGTHAITAVYDGDANFLTANSAALSQVVQDFNVAIATSGTTTQSIIPGQTAIYNFTLAPVQSATFPAAVTLSLSGLPAGASYTITPQTVAANSGPTPVTLSITLPQQVAALQSRRPLGGFPFRPALAFLLMPFAGLFARRKHGRSPFAAMLLLFIAGSAGVIALSGCGSSNGFLSQQPKTYTLTLSGTSGALIHSVTVTLNVQ